jgi:hypothetical protein
MNFYLIKKTLFICLYFIIFVFFRDILYALLIRFFDHWVSSFIILPSITLAILLIIKIYINRFDFTYLNEIKIDFIFLIKVLFMCVCLYVFSVLLYVLLERYDLFNSIKSSDKLSFISCSAVILASVVEELFFRGYLLQYAIDSKIENNLVKKVFFSILTSVLFSIAHMRFDLFIFQYFFFSLICSLIFIRSKNIFYTIIFHFFFNIMAVTNFKEILQIKELNLICIMFLLMFFFLLLNRQMLKLKCH